MIKPKPCPFCGNHQERTGPLYTYDAFRWGCADCGASGPVKPSEHEAIFAWNRLTMLPEGWVVVPREPTKEMMDNVFYTEVFLNSLIARDAYKAMIATAPEPQPNNNLGSEMKYGKMRDGSYLHNCLIIKRDDDKAPYLFEQKANDESISVFLDGYAIIPLEKYQELTGEDFEQGVFIEASNQEDE